jgi:hypothetical protein
MNGRGIGCGNGKRRYLIMVHDYSTKLYYELCRTSVFCRYGVSYRAVARQGTGYHPVGSNTKYFIHILILGFLHFLILNLLNFFDRSHPVVFKNIISYLFFYKHNRVEII